MKSLLKDYLVFLAIIIMIANYSCKKKDIAETVTGYSRVKIYDDTLASVLNTSLNIASGDKRIFLSYGIGNSNLIAIVGFGNYYITSGSYAKIIATDNSGKLIWQSTLPKENIVSDILALDDGGCIASCLKLDKISGVSTYIYLFRFDANGQNILNDSITLALPGGVLYYNTVNLMQSINGNMLLYGNYVNTASEFDDYAGEYDLSLNPIWAKQYSNLPYYPSTSACVKTNDGGYLFAGSYSQDIGPGKIALRKTNATGDTLWTKNIYSNTATFNDLINSNDGNYLVSFYTDANDINQTFVYKVNAAGDSINATAISKPDQLYNNGLIATDDGGVFALMNSNLLPTIYLAPYLKNNSSSVLLDASLNLKNNQFLQTQTNDYFNHACKTSDGKIAVAGLVQMAGQAYYKPSLLIYK